MAAVEVASAQSALQEEKVDNTNQAQETCAIEQQQEVKEAQQPQVETVPASAELESQEKKEEQQSSEPDEAKDEAVQQELPPKEEEIKVDQAVEEANAAVKDLELEKKDQTPVEEGSSKVAPEPVVKEEIKVAEDETAKTAEPTKAKVEEGEAKVAPAPAEPEEATAVDAAVAAEKGDAA